MARDRLNQFTLVPSQRDIRTEDKPGPKLNCCSLHLEAALELTNFRSFIPAPGTIPHIAPHPEGDTSIS